MFFVLFLINFSFYFIGGTIGAKGHTFSIRTDAADKTINAVRKTLPHTADVVVLYFLFVGEKEELGLFELDPKTNLPVILKLNQRMFEINIDILSLYATILLKCYENK